MDPVASAVLSSWVAEPSILLGLLLPAALYCRGFREVHGQLASHFPRWRLIAFLTGIATLMVALFSPLDAFADVLLQVHMTQHWLLMMVAPPLLWLGAPAVPLLRGLPRSWLIRGLGPFLAWPALRGMLRSITRPTFSWLAWAGVLLVWHWPGAYQAALRSPFWHDLEHISFLIASLLFWYPIVSPWPARSRGEHPGLLLYLGLAAIFNTVFSSAFAFSTRVFYPLYQDAMRPWGVQALADQNAAGALLWVGSSIPMLIAAVALVRSILEPIGTRRPRARPLGSGTRRRSNTIQPVLASIPGFVRSVRLRRALQWGMFGLAAVVMVDGLFGTQVPSAMNLAGTLPWNYWRGLVVMALLVFGNVFCAVCPFTLSRRLSARWFGRRLRWPKALRNKWLAVALFAGYLWAYEAFSLWDSPWWTAWLVVGYFAACFLIEGLFPRGTFCRHVCPIGQFQFVASGISPTEIRADNPDICRHCLTRDCLRGGNRGPGCPTGLWLPTKRGNLDCTFCLDCIRACPHENAKLVATAPGSRLGGSRSDRPDVAAFTLLFGFGAFANAAAMVEPVARWEEALAAWLPAGTPLTVLTVWLGCALGVIPIGSVLFCAAMARKLSGVELSLRERVLGFVPTLVPIGFSMWLTHFGFHFFASFGASPETLTGLEIAGLGAGLVVSVAVAWRIALEFSAWPRQALRMAAPWVLLTIALYSIGIWIVLQPMEMRGMVMS